MWNNNLAKTIFGGIILYKHSFVHYLTKILVDILFCLGIACTISFPFLLPKIMEFLQYDKELVAPYNVVLIASGICSVYILWQLKQMFKTLLSGNPFVGKNVDALRKCAVASFAIGLIYLLKIICFFTIASCVIFIIFMLLSLFCLTLKDVFKQAVYYKEENDLTI